MFKSRLTVDIEGNVGKSTEKYFTVAMRSGKPDTPPLWVRVYKNKYRADFQKGDLIFVKVAFLVNDQGNPRVRINKNGEHYALYEAILISPPRVLKKKEGG